MESIMSHPITAVPTSLFHEDRSMRKTQKSELRHKLEEPIEVVKLLPNFNNTSSFYIREVVAEFHKIPGM